MNSHTVKLNFLNEGVLSGLKLTQISLLAGFIVWPLARISSELAPVASLIMLLSTILFLLGQARCCLNDTSKNLRTIRFSTACSFGALLLPLAARSVGLIALAAPVLNALSFLSLLMYAAATAADNGQHDVAKRFRRALGGIVLAPLFFLIVSKLQLDVAMVIATILLLLVAILAPISYIRGVSALGQRGALAPC